jgi:hypothetical protein
MTTMTQAMEAHLRMNTARAFDATARKFGAALSRTMTQPMPTLTDTIVFKIAVPGGEVREFTAAFTLTELSTTNATPTPGYND